jgi:hypothetical protein
MTAENFTYWLQGFLEIQNPEKINKTQVQIIKDHIALVLTKVTPDREPETDEMTVLIAAMDKKDVEEVDNIDSIFEEIERQEKEQEAGWYAEDLSDQPGVILDCHQDTFCTS